MKSTRIVVMALAVILLISCQMLATPYQKMGDGSAYGGYKDQKISANEYSIEVYGNGYSSYSELEDYFHRRAKELAHGKQYDYKIERGNEKYDDKATNQDFSNPYIKGTIKIR